MSESAPEVGGDDLLLERERREGDYDENFAECLAAVERWGKRPERLQAHEIRGSMPVLGWGALMPIHKLAKQGLKGHGRKALEKLFWLQNPRTISGLNTLVHNNWIWREMNKGNVYLYTGQVRRRRGGIRSAVLGALQFADDLIDSCCPVNTTGMFEKPRYFITRENQRQIQEYVDQYTAAEVTPDARNYYRAMTELTEIMPYGLKDRTFTFEEWNRLLALVELQKRIGQRL